MIRFVLVVLLLFVADSPGFSNPLAARPPVNTLQELRVALWSCWSPPAGTQSFRVTISFSFKRSGEVLGKPRITYSTFAGKRDEQARIMNAILTSLEACTPVNITPALGGAIAGQVFTITFTSPSTEARSVPRGPDRHQDVS